ncbi:MAG: hypothetical protein K0S21_3770 [Rhizobiaceae bacterium]|jgi:transposase-like protein|nr:hypothetical protein [Rhizobiaceae bacterium]MCD6072355.1 hypothetical protein [Microvirga sp.]
MTRQTRYSPEVRARAVRMVLEHRGEHAKLLKNPNVARYLERHQATSRASCRT